MARAGTGGGYFGRSVIKFMTIGFFRKKEYSGKNTEKEEAERTDENTGD